MIAHEAESDRLAVAEKQAMCLSRGALLLDQAKQKSDDRQLLTYALNENLEVWVAIKTIAERPDTGLSDSVRDNLIRLCNYVADTTFKSAEEISEQAIDTLININLQISEGLLEGLQSQ
jgi:flagellar biosynthesis regulator FlaF